MQPERRLKACDWHGPGQADCTPACLPSSPYLAGSKLKAKNPKGLGGQRPPIPLRSAPMKKSLN